MTATPGIVTTQWLNDNLLKPGLCILDVTWFSTRDARTEYSKEHIPGAVFFDLFKDVNNTDVLPRNVADPAIFEKNARDAGINADSHVIVYDNEGKCGFFLGSRAWWTFQYFGHNTVSVLDGGLQKWKSDGFKVTDDVTDVKPGNFTSKVDKNIRKDANFVRENLSQKAAQILDSRPAELFKGKADDARSGHVPGAVNIPFAANLLDKEKGTFKSKDDLRKVFADHGISLEKPIVTMCNSGMSSCSLLLASRVAGAENTSVFHGGFTEWKSVATDSEIEKS